MKLLRVQVISGGGCGDLLDDFELVFRRPSAPTAFDPFCLIGPNGAGKSQFLQVLAEMFQVLFQACVPEEERGEPNPTLFFELEYEIEESSAEGSARVRVTRVAAADGTPGELKVERREGREWSECPLSSPLTHRLLPTKVVAYTSGDNETLSAPFVVSRGAYADAVAEQALDEVPADEPIQDPRLLLVDYSTHLEVLAANLLLADGRQRRAMLEFAELEDMHSFRCIVQLRPRSGPAEGVQLTPELRRAIENLQKCATCVDLDEKREQYTLDFLVGEDTRAAFSHYWEDPFDLYTTLHKLGMLNYLAIPRATRQRFRRQTNAQRFAARLPEPQDEDKVFRFERVRFHKRGSGGAAGFVDYVALSDGEHQQALLLGTMGMLSYPGVLFLLDEPESHFNPRWRVECISRIRELPTGDGKRSADKAGGANAQECLLTTHAPFVPSDLERGQVLVFSKEDERIVVRRPDIETFGATFDTILDAGFQVTPPISGVAKDEIESLEKSEDPEEIRDGLRRLGPSVEKAFVADRLRALERKDD